MTMTVSFVILVQRITIISMNATTSCYCQQCPGGEDAGDCRQRGQHAERQLGRPRQRLLANLIRRYHIVV